MTKINKNKKTKILIAITKSNWGGAQKYVFDIATNLDFNKYDVVVAFGGNGELKNKLQDLNIKTVSLDSLGRDINFFKDIKSFLDLYKIIKSENPDILHLNSSKIGATGSLIGRLLRIPKIIFTAHGWAFSEDRSTLSKIIFRSIAYLTIFLSHKTILVSKGLKKQLGPLPFSKNKTVLIYNGIGNIDFLNKEIARTEIENILKIKISKKIWIGNIGELHHIKGQNYAIEAFKEINNPDIGLFITGEGEKRSDLEKQIKESSLQESVFLLGNIKNASRYLKAFDIYIHPSLSEALAFAILEAGKAEIPIIASRVGGIPEIINANEGILIEPRKPELIKKSIENIINNPELAKKYSKNLKTRIDTEFSISKMIKETEELYSK